MANINDAYKSLACGILIQAAKDFQNQRFRKEVMDFFDSEWFEIVCEMAGFNPIVFKKKLFTFRYSQRQKILLAKKSKAKL